MPDNSRSDLRKARYQYLRELGYSSKDARRLRDQSIANINQNVATVRRRIVRKSQAQRTESERRQLQLIREKDLSRQPAKQDRRYETYENRYDNFTAWTGSKSFPKWAIKYIESVNKSNRLPARDAYGYRQFYYWYVERIELDQLEFYASRNDSGIRHIHHIPLRSKQSLRRSA